MENICNIFILVIISLRFVYLSNVTYKEGHLKIYKGEKKQKNDIVIALDLPYELCPMCITKPSGSGYNTGRFYASAAAIAVEDINNDKEILKNYRLRYIWNTNRTDTHCNEMDAIKITMKQINLEVDGFVGFTCHCKTVAKMISAVNLPFFSGSCAEMELSQKNEYPTFARTTTLNNDVIYMILKLLYRYNWKRFGVFYEESHIFQSVYKAFKKEVEIKDDLEITVSGSYSKDEHHQNYFNQYRIFQPFINQLPGKARIVLLMIDKSSLQQFMVFAHKKGLTNGDYIFIAVHPFAALESFLRTKTIISNFVWVMPWGNQNPTRENLFADREIIKKAFQTLFVLMPQVPTINDSEFAKYEKFTQRVREGMSSEPFCSDVYTGKSGGRLKNQTKVGDNCIENLTDCIYRPPPEAYQLYDAVMLYALGLNKTIEKGYSIRNGSDIIQNILNIEHQSVSGSPFVVNCKADVQVLFEVAQFQFDDEIDENSSYWLPKRVFVFEHKNEGSSKNCTDKNFDRNRFVLKKGNNTVKWVLGQIPKDTPDCGFHNEKCQKSVVPKGMVLGLAISLSILVIIIFIIPYSLYRNFKLKAELKAQPWKIHSAELFFHDWSVSTSSLGSLTSFSGSLLGEMPTKQQYITTAYYKGEPVAVKKINTSNVELSKSVLMELKQARDVCNENLNRFIGACVEPHNVLIISKYAQRGSLQDVLEHDDIQLDASFILSLVYDIIKGMLYLHSTDIKSHGNLKSSNCVIDSRWVLKISDFGLNTFRSRHGTISSIESESCNKLLWRAPELLRYAMPPTSRGTQKGDVYSFGIILQECHTRDGAWGSYQDPEAIIEKVKKRLNPPFRPVVREILDDAEGLWDMMQKCWKENPEERPYFSELRKDVEVMMKANGMRANLVENVIAMLEKYSKNLEAVVAERTSSLNEEKQKVEGLLERMLPKSVAKQLMKGKQVEAVYFEEVTIYFSDIVGFTDICASIPPMEVVNLLNTLYTMFDNIASDYDVYKVETIGDAYMVVSGLPIRNMQQHVKEICLMALDIMDNMKSFKIRPREKQLEIRTGIHTGPVVAGVVGTTMPRYCLFGDTVNVGSRMETTGKACRIHISSQTQTALKEFDGFHIESRGKIQVKGRGLMETYWLNGAEPKLVRKQTLSKRDQNTLYEHNKNSPSFTRLIRESPKVPRHRLHVTPTTTDYSRTSPLNPPLLNPPPSNREQRSGGLNYFKALGRSCRRQRSVKHATEMTDYINLNETQSLIAHNVVKFPEENSNHLPSIDQMPV